MNAEEEIAYLKGVMDCRMEVAKLNLENHLPSTIFNAQTEILGIVYHRLGRLIDRSDDRMDRMKENFEKNERWIKNTDPKLYEKIFTDKESINDDTGI